MNEALSISPTVPPILLLDTAVRLQGGKLTQLNDVNVRLSTRLIDRDMSGSLNLVLDGVCDMRHAVYR